MNKQMAGILTAALLLASCTGGDGNANPTASTATTTASATATTTPSPSPSPVLPLLYPLLCATLSLTLAYRPTTLLLDFVDICVYVCVVFVMKHLFGVDTLCIYFSH